MAKKTKPRAKTMLSYDDDMETQMRRQLLEKAPLPYHESRGVPYSVPYSLFGHEVRPTLLKTFQQEHPDESAIDRETRIQDETQRRWEEELSGDDQQVYETRLETMKSEKEAKYQAHRQANKAFHKQLKDLVAQTTVKNSIVVNRHHSESGSDYPEPRFPSQVRRYPDHEFAIAKSRIVINWSLVNCLLLFLDGGSLSVPQALVADTNIPGVIPHFVDSSWIGSDLVYGYCRAAKKKHMDILPEEERELKWVATGYYKVYPPDDEYIPDDDDGIDFLGHSLPFSRLSIQRYLQTMKDDIFGQQAQWTKKTFVEPVFTDDSITGQLKAPVTAFQSQRGDRVEFWDYDREDGDDYGSYAILQTHQGRVVVLAVSESHPYVFCNLLEFFNSDGSADMPDLLPAPDDGGSVDDQTMAKILVENILITAEAFLYRQMH